MRKPACIISYNSYERQVTEVVQDLPVRPSHGEHATASHQKSNRRAREDGRPFFLLGCREHSARGAGDPGSALQALFPLLQGWMP